MLDDVNKFSMEIMGEMQIDDDDIDLSSFDDAFDSPVEEMSELFQIEDLQNQNLGERSQVEQRLISNIDQVKSAVPRYPHEYFSMDREEDMNRCRQAPENCSVSPTEPKTELDEQIEATMSTLIQSMHRSEMTRNMLGHQQSAGQSTFGNLFTSSFASGIAQSRTQLNQYMSQMGKSSMLK